MATDALKLVTIARTRPGAKLIIAFADEDAAAYATTGTWVSKALALWGIEVLVAELGEPVREGIRAAQLRQKMVSPTAPLPPGIEVD